MESKKYRLLTRSDFDGLVCAILLKELNMLGDIKFVHPKDVQDGIIEIDENDILTNLPYNENCYLCFDHHASEEIRNTDQGMTNYVLEPHAQSAARVVYKHFGGQDGFPRVNPEMLNAVDKADSAQFSKQDVLHPEGWELLSFLMDPRTGLGRFRDFRVSNYQLMMDLIDYCRDHTIEETLMLPDVQERVELYNQHCQKFEEQLRRCGTMHDHVLVLDLRDEETIFAGNRFMPYAVFPECNISIHVIWGLQKQNTVFAIGKSIFDRSSTTNIGELTLAYGGGGHEAAGTCQIDNEEAASVLSEIIARINADANTCQPTPN